MADYVDRNSAGTLRVAGTRVSMASVVHAYTGGETPETIVQAFPSLTLELAFGAIAYYLANKAEVDREVASLEDEWKAHRSAATERNRDLRAKILAGRKKAAS